MDDREKKIEEALKKFKDARDDLALYPIGLIILAVLLFFGIPFYLLSVILSSLIN